MQTPYTCESSLYLKFSLEKLPVHLNPYKIWKGMCIQLPQRRID